MSRRRRLRWKQGLLGFSLLAACALGAVAEAADVQWQGAGTGGNTATDPNDPNTQWDEPANWQGGALPDANDTANLQLDNAGYVYAGTTSVNLVSLDGASATATLVFGESVDFVSHDMEVGLTANGQCLQTGGLNTVTDALRLGCDVGAVGTYRLEAGTLDTYGTGVGAGGAGNFVQTGGLHNSHGVILYAGWGALGTYDLQGGSLLTNTTSIGGSGGEQAHFTQSGGEHGARYFRVSGIYDLVDGTLEVSSEFKLSSPGVFRQTGGQCYARDEFRLEGISVYEMHDGYLLGYLGGHADIGYFSGDNPVFDQSGGFYNVAPALRIGVLAGSKGTYKLRGGELEAASGIKVGHYGEGTFIQTGGTNTVKEGISLAYQAGSKGTYTLEDGELDTGTESIYVGERGEGSFLQTGGTITAGSILLGREEGGAGTYTMEGGTITLSGGIVMASESGSSGEFHLKGGTVNTYGAYVGEGGQALFVQTGGTYVVRSGIQVSPRWDSEPATYELRDGLIQNPGYLRLGYGYGTTVGGTFIQTGGMHTVGYVNVSPNSLFEYSGGTLQIDGGLRVEGVLDVKDQALMLNAPESAIVDFTTGTFAGCANADFAIGPNSLAIVGGGVDPNAMFANYSNAGMTHVAGTTLAVSDTEGFGGWGDLYDHVQCAGWIAADTGGDIHMRDGLELSDNATVDLGTGQLFVLDTVSGMDSGQLEAGHVYVGSPYVTQGGYDGVFTQTGGTHSPYHMQIGDGYSGTYTLDDGHLGVVWSERIACTDPNKNSQFIQTGGTHTVGGELELADRINSTGSYELHAGQLSVGTLRVGDRGTGVFTHFDGDSQVGDLILAEETGSAGTYTLHSGTLSAATVRIGRNGDAQFIQSGGVHTVGTDLELGGDGDTATYHMVAGDLTVHGSEYHWFSEVSTLFVQEAGTHTVDNDLNLGYGHRPDSIYRQVNGTHRVGRLLMGVESGRGTYELQGGLLETTETLMAYSRSPYGTYGDFQHTGGTHQVSKLVVGVDDYATYELSDGLLQASEAHIGYEDGSSYSGGLFEQTGGRHEVDSLFIRSGGSSGGYRLTGGVLVAGQIQPTHEYFAFDFTGGELHAQTVGFDLTNDGGVLSPGESIGQTLITGDYTQNAGSLRIELASLVEFDTVSIGGTAVLAGDLDLRLIDGFVPAIGQEFSVLTASTITEDFDSVPECFTTRIDNGTDLVVTYIPEPASLAVLALGGVAVMRRRRS